MDSRDERVAPAQLQPGQRVRIYGRDEIGIVRAVHGRSARVEVAGRNEVFAFAELELEEEP